MYLYDTNIISELTKRNRNPNLVNFVSQVANSDNPAYMSTITLGEIVKGISKLRRRNDFIQAQQLQNWYDTNLSLLISDTLVFDDDCSKIWGELMAINPHDVADKQIVATAMVHDLILVTRNVQDIEQTGVRFINPFEMTNF